MNSFVLSHCSVYQQGRFAPGEILVEDGVITRIGQGVPRPAGLPEIDGGGMRAVPGFIDAHTHGAVGVDVNAADEAGLKKIAAFFASQGVTAFNASVLTDTEEQTLRCIETIKKVARQRGYGAQLLGAHLEGPFLSPQYKGAMPEWLLRAGDTDLLKRYMASAGETLRYLTVAPEVPGVAELIPYAAPRTAVALGHSGATYEQSMQAIRDGARAITHTFNGMQLFHQHAPGLMGAGLESDVWCEAICDGRHLHPGAVRMLLKCKGYGRVAAVTDSIMAAGLPDGRYRLGVNDVIVKDGDARLAVGDSRAGSTLTMHQAMLNLMRFTSRPLEAVLPLLTQNPAELLRVDRRKGRLAPGLDADIVLLDDRYRVARTFVRGDCVYQGEESQ